VIDETYRRHLKTIPANDDGPIWLVALTRSGEGAELKRRFEPIVATAGGQVVVHGTCTPVGPFAAHWDQLTVVKFPTRRHVAPDHPGLLAIRPAEAIILGCIPSPTMTLSRSADAPEWTDVAYPASDADSPIIAVHVVRYRADCDSPDAMATHAALLDKSSIAHGARNAHAFAVEGTIVGDGRQWDEVRLSAYPSAAAFSAVLNELGSMTGFCDRRGQLVEDSYALGVRPVVDRLARSLVS